MGCESVKNTLEPIILQMPGILRHFKMKLSIINKGTMKPLVLSPGYKSHGPTNANHFVCYFILTLKEGTNFAQEYIISR